MGESYDLHQIAALSSAVAQALAWEYGKSHSSRIPLTGYPIFRRGGAETTTECRGAGQGTLNTLGADLRDVYVLRQALPQGEPCLQACLLLVNLQAGLDPLPSR